MNDKVTLEVRHYIYTGTCIADTVNRHITITEKLRYAPTIIWNDIMTLQANVKMLTNRSIHFDVFKTVFIFHILFILIRNL